MRLIGLMDPFRHQRLLISLLGGAAATGLDLAAIDSDTMVRLAAGHRLSGLLARAMEHDSRAWPAGLKAALEEAARKTLLDNIVLVRALHDAGALLESEGVPFVLLKGASLLGFLYEDLRLRPMTDIDLLIRQADWPRVRDALGARSYRLPPAAEERRQNQVWYHQLVATPTHPSCYIEFHWNLESSERSRIDAGPLMEQAVPCEVEGRRFQRLSDDHLLLHLAVHLAHHYDRPSLHWVEDLRRLLARGQLDWAVIEDQARAWEVYQSLAYSLRAVERIAPGSLPAGARRLRLSLARRAVVAALSTSDPSLPHRSLENHPLRHAVSMALMDRWTAAAAYICRHAVRRWRRARRPGV